MSEWFKRQRLNFIKEHLQTYGSINRSDIINKFDVSVAVASKDLSDFQKQNRGEIYYNKSQKKYKLVKSTDDKDNKKTWVVRHEGSEDMPWSVTENHELTGAMYDYICRIISWKNQEKHARLIAASPEMLKALKGILESFHSSVLANVEDFPALFAVKKAIEKATGESA